MLRLVPVLAGGVPRFRQGAGLWPTSAKHWAWVGVVREADEGGKTVLTPHGVSLQVQQTQSLETLESGARRF
jgi:hypothetical protein